MPRNYSLTPYFLDNHPQARTVLARVGFDNTHLNTGRARARGLVHLIVH